MRRSRELFDAEGASLGPSGGRRGHVSGTFFHAIAPPSEARCRNVDELPRERA